MNRQASLGIRHHNDTTAAGRGRHDNQSQEPSLLARAIRTREEERGRISRELHGVLGRRVTALRLRAEAIRRGELRDLDSRVDELIRLIDQVDRDLDFVVWELSPPESLSDGLGPALKAFVHDWSDTHHIPADLMMNGFVSTRLERDIENAVYWISQEALNNVGKHARASRVAVLLEQHDDRIVLTVHDDGCGFNPSDEVGRPHKGLGLTTMRERAALVRGRLEVETVKGCGTSVIATVPAVLSPRAVATA